MEVNGQLHAPATLPARKRVPDIQWIGGWVGLRADLNAGEYRKLSCSCWESNRDFSDVQLEARRYTD
jgi:hypothetical protein